MTTKTKYVIIIIEKRKEIHTMTREQIEKRINELKNRKFALAMCDRWTQEDYDLDKELFEKINKLEKELNK